MKCNIVGCGKIEGGFEDGICLPCYSFITADQGKEHMSVDEIREVINIIEQMITDEEEIA